MSESIPLVEVLSQEEIDLIEAEVSHIPDRESAAIEALRIVQEKRGYVSDESLRAIAKQLEMSVEGLDSIATFYNLIFRRPVGEQVILVCNSVSCWIKGCEGLRETISQQLGIAPGETTGDGRFTLLPVTCLGACDRAPVMMVGEHKFEDVTPEQIAAILDEGEGATPA